MAEKEISTLIRRQQEIIRFLDPLIVKQEKIKTLLDDKIKEIQMHHLGCNIARTIGTGTATAGASLAVSSLLRLSLNPVLTAVGLGAAVVGKLVTFATNCADEVKGKTFIKNAQDIVASQNDLAERLKEELNDFQQFLMTMLSSQSTEMLENTGLSLKQRFGRQQSSLVQSHSDLCGKMSVDIDFQSLINSFVGRCVEVANLVNIVQMSKTLMPTLAAALQAIGVLKEIEKIIQSWIRKHPSEVAILEILERLLESIKILKRLRKDLNENVVLLEEKLSVITAVVTYEKIMNLIDPLISKQEKTVNWAVQEEAKLSIPYMITRKIIMIMIIIIIISMLTAIAAFGLGLLGEVIWGCLKIVATCLLIIAVPAFLAEDFLFEHFVKTLKEEIIERQFSVNNLEKNLKEINQHPRLRQLLETGSKISNVFDARPVEVEIGWTPDSPLIEASTKIGLEISELASQKSTSKRLSGLQDLLAEASVLLEAIGKLGYIGSAIDRWLSRNDIEDRLVSQMPTALINYTKNVKKLLECYKEAHESSRLLSYRL